MSAANPCGQGAELISEFRFGTADFARGLELRPVWVALAQEDVENQHRRTLLGPIWLLLNYLLFAGTFIFIFHRGDAGQDSYAAYVATGLLVWFYYMEAINKGVGLFAKEENFIKGTTLPLSVYVLRQTYRTIIRSSYAFVGCLFILFVSGASPSTGWMWAGLGIAATVAITPAIIALFAFLGAFMPDSVFVVSNLMRVGMFVSPVFWQVEDSSGLRKALFEWNPFTYAIEVIRTPVLSGEFPYSALLACVVAGTIAWAAALWVLGRYRQTLVFIL